MAFFDNRFQASHSTRARDPRPARRLALALLCISAVVLVVGATRPPSRAAARQAAPAFQPLTVERIYGRPSLSGSLTQGIQWRPDGRLLSFFEKDSEGRSGNALWAMDAEAGERRLLVSAEQLRPFLPAEERPRGQQTGLGRVAPRQYFWSPRGDALLFVAGNGLYWYDLKTQVGKRLAEARSSSSVEDPKISPDGRWVSFVRDYDLWAVRVATGEEVRLTRDGREEQMNAKLDWVYPEELGIRTACWWSPDSTAIAYLQMDERSVTRYPLVNFLSYTGETHWMRYPKAGDANPVVRLGVVNLPGTPAAPTPATRWIDTGPDTNVYIARVAWLPDSKRLAFERLNRAQNRLELVFASAADGHSQAILTEQDPYWVNLHDDLYFLSDGQRFLWSSERDGFRHLYLYDLSGRLLQQLTRGSWQVTGLAGVDEKDGWTYFTATEKSPIERQLYRVALSGGTAIQITRGDGTHNIELAPDAAHYVDTYSTALTPPRQDVYRADGGRVAALDENSVPELASYHLQPVEFFTVPGADGTPLEAQMLKPPGFDPSRKYPVIVHLYGGPAGQVVRNAWGSSNFLWHQMMAQRGYIIFTVDNRGMAGRGHNFETSIFHHFGQVELADQLAGVNYLKSLSYVDASRIGIWGWSFGGYMTCTAMLNAGDVFKAGFAGSPVTDWRQYDTIYTERYMGLPQENAEGYQQSSPVNHVAGLKGKLLIAVGTGDDNVHFANTIELSEQLIRAGRYAEILIYPGRGHGITDSPARIHLFRRVTQFFLDNL